jgi:DNA transposition AAA+ family ATPase
MSKTKSEIVFSDQEMEAVRAAVIEIMLDEGKSKAELARESGVAYQTFSSWALGNYTGDNHRVTNDIQLWLKARSDKKIIARTVPEIPEFMMLPSAENFIDTMNFAQVLPEMSIVVGAAGLGKTSAAKYYAKNNPNVWLVTMDPSMASPHGMMVEICAILGITERNPTRLSRAIARRVNGSGGLLVIDEAQHLDFKALEILRSVYDRADGSIGIALVGNESLLAKLEGEGRKGSHAQIYSRIGIRTTQTTSKTGDINALATAWGIEKPDEIKLLKIIARKPGALRSLTKVLQLASMISVGADEERNIKHIEAAWTRLGTSRRTIS